MILAASMSLKDVLGAEMLCWTVPLSTHLDRDREQRLAARPPDT